MAVVADVRDEQTEGWQLSGFDVVVEEHPAVGDPVGNIRTCLQAARSARIIEVESTGCAAPRTSPGPRQCPQLLGIASAYVLAVRPAATSLSEQRSTVQPMCGGDIVISDTECRSARQYQVIRQ